MVVDTSAIVAILYGEPEAEVFNLYIARDERPCLSAATLIEAHLLLSKTHEFLRLLDRFISEAGFEIISVDREIAALARYAAIKYGKNTSANLNFGDLFAYATAKKLKMPLLFKGDDFSHTDLEFVTLNP